MASAPTDTFSPLDLETFSAESKAVIDFIAEYYKNVEKYPVQSKVKPGYLSAKFPKFAPFSPESLEDILRDTEECILPGLTHWQSPNFFAFFPASASTAAFLGEMLCSGLNVNGFNWIASPASTELESIVVDWLGKMLKLPSSFLFSGTGGGVLHGTTCEAVTCVLAAARDKALKEYGGSSGNITKLVVYASDQTHFAIQKAAKLVGIPSSNFRSLPTSISKEFSLSPKQVRSAIEYDAKSGFIPLFLCATIGTTGCGAVDPIEELGKIAEEYKLWFHVDAAYAGNACICPEYRHYLNGIELASSISMNPHKWFLTNLDCASLWVKQPKFLVDSLSCDSEYVRGYESEESKFAVDYKDWQISLTKKFRALKLWIVIRRHGVANLISHIRSDIAMAERFESWIRADERFEVVVPRRFALVCFRMKVEKEAEGVELNKKLLKAVNSTGHVFLTNAMVGGIFVIRCAIGATMTEERHVVQLWKLIQENASTLLKN